MPHGHTSLLVALEESLFPFQTVIIRGNPAALVEWHAAAARPYHPARLTLAIPDDADGLPGLLAQREAHDHCVAYICSGTQCGTPVTSLPQLQAQLGSAANRKEQSS
jgi:uncharacterized protein YyaL (SSP411 family)